MGLKHAHKWVGVSRCVIGLKHDLPSHAQRAGTHATPVRVVKSHHVMVILLL